MFAKTISAILFCILWNMSIAQTFGDIHNLYNQYENYKESELFTPRFKHNDLMNLLDKHRLSGKYQFRLAGESVEGRTIHLLKYGNGIKKVFIWTQMHGDEPTATMAVCDLLNFFEKSDNFDKLRETISKNLSIYILPLVNPDGAERFSRRNAMDIDINRDAASLSTPEARILNSCADSIKPDFGFNMHDQDPMYSVGMSQFQATLAFLAPAYNYEKEINPTRLKAIKLISELVSSINNFIPGHIGKYTDDFSPRAFGDNFQKKGISTILIESGGYKNDSEKQFIRKMNFIALLNAFYSIAIDNYANFDEAVYDKLPFIEENIHEIIIRNLEVPSGKTKALCDFAINTREVPNGNRTMFISDKGDLSVFYGLQDYDFKGMKAVKWEYDLKKHGRIDKLSGEKWKKILSEIDISKTNENIPLGRCSALAITLEGRIKYVFVDGMLFETEKFN